MGLRVAGRSRPLISCVVVTAAALVSLIRASSDHIALPPLRGVASACALGPFLMLEFLIFQSPAFVASATGLSVPAATIVILVQDAVALGLVAWIPVHPPPYRVTLLAGAALVGFTFSFTWVDEPVVVGALVAGGALAGGLLFLSLSRIRAANAPASLWPPAAALGAGTFLFFALVLLYQIHYDMPLPLPNSLLFQLAAALLASFCFPLRAGIPSGRPAVPNGRTYRSASGPTVPPDPPSVGAVAPRAQTRMQAWGLRAAAAPLALTVIPGIALLTTSEPRVPASADTFRLMNYNIHSAVNGEGQLDAEGIARVIQAQRPDVVTLQEVSRGWAIAGTTDLAEWLSHRLNMRYVYAPAADGQFGNVVLSRLPIVASERVYLPTGAGPMRRSYARAEVDVGNGQSVDVISVHLQHREQNTRTRLTQIAVLIDTWQRARPTVLAGDLNAEPGSQEVAEFENLGLVSAQDVTGHEELATSPSRGPRVRIDWIFGTHDVGFAEFSIPRTTASDHLPMAVDVTIRR